MTWPSELLRSFRSRRERHQKARASGEKIARLKLNPSLAQRLVQAVILPQAHYGIQMRPIPQQQLKILKTTIKKAMGIARRAHSWYMLCVVAHPVHLTDPGAHAAYIHIQAVWKGLKEGQAMLHRRWEDQAEQQWRQVPQGPYCTYLAYLRRWQIEFARSGIEVYLADKWVDVLRNPLGECLHALREHFRVQMLSRAAQTRHHLLGARGVDIKRTCQLTRKEGFRYRAELIQILSDGVWPQGKKYRCRLVDSGECPWCGQHEDLEHIWYHCPQWNPFRKLLNLHGDFLRAASPAVGLCFVATSEIPDALRKLWNKIQEEAATVLHWRQNTQPKVLRGLRQELNNSPVGTHVPLIPDRQMASRSYSFHLNERLFAQKVEWPFSRRAWRNVNYWASQLRVFLDPQDEPPTLLEALLSFILTCEGTRLETGLGADRHGEWVSQQLNAFRRALLAFQEIARGEILVGRQICYQRDEAWSRTLGLPRQEILQLAIRLPQWERAREHIARMPMDLIGEATMGLGRELWRRWAPGRPGSQVEGPENFIAKPLWELPRYAIRGKMKQVPWQAQTGKVRRFYSDIDMVGAHDLWVGEDMKEWLMQQGATDLEGLRAEARSQRYAVKRAERLMQHNMKLAEQKWHFADWWEVKTRPTCKACMRQGSTTRQMSFLMLGCPRANEVDLCQIQAQQAKLCEIRDKADQRARALFLIAKTLA